MVLQTLLHWALEEETFSCTQEGIYSHGVVIVNVVKDYELLCCMLCFLMGAFGWESWVLRKTQRRQSL